MSELILELPGAKLNAANLEDLHLTFQYTPSSKIFGTDENTVVDLGEP